MGSWAFVVCAQLPMSKAPEKTFFKHLGTVGHQGQNTFLSRFLPGSTWTRKAGYTREPTVTRERACLPPGSLPRSLRAPGWILGSFDLDQGSGQGSGQGMAWLRVNPCLDGHQGGTSTGTRDRQPREPRRDQGTRDRALSAFH